MFSPETRILVVDDFVTMRAEMKQTLGSMGFKNIVEAEDGRKAWEVLNGSSPPIELVFSDWNMPGSTGIDLLKRVRTDGRYKNLPFILVTTENEKQAILQAVQSGVSNYIVKPYTAEIVKQKLEAVYKKIYG